VKTIKVDVDAATGRIVVPVEVSIYPARMRTASRTPMEARSPQARQKFISDLVSRGMRAQLRSGSLVTGQLYIALDFFPAAPKTSINWASAMVELPTTPGARQELQAAIASVAAKIERLPLDEIGKDVRTVLGSTDRVMKRVDTEIAPDLRQTLQSGSKLLVRLDSELVGEARGTLVDTRAVLGDARKAMVSADRLLSAEAPLQVDTREAMREISRAASAFRVLADYLERNPQALLMGKREDAP
jgi:paraquat-inducible protein B